MSFIVIDAEEYILKIHEDNFLEFTIKEGVTIDVEVILEAKKIVEEYKPGVKFFVLSEGAGFFNVTMEARKLSATKEFSSHLASIAFYTTNLSLIFLGEMYNNINKPAVRTKIFHSRYSAHEWLKGQMADFAVKSA